MALVAVLARHRSHLASDMGKQGFDIAPSLQIENLLWTSLLSKPHTRLSR
jgi:hypothetical protein